MLVSVPVWFVIAFDLLFLVLFVATLAFIVLAIIRRTVDALELGRPVWRGRRLRWWPHPDAVSGMGGLIEWRKAWVRTRGGLLNEALGLLAALGLLIGGMMTRDVSPPLDAVPLTRLVGNFILESCIVIVAARSGIAQWVDDSVNRLRNRSRIRR